MISKYAKGCRFDLPRHRTQKDARLALPRVAVLPDSASLEAFEYRPILDQNDCGSCTGHGTAQGIFVAMAAEGHPLGFLPSPKSIYALGRGLTRAADHAKDKTLPPLTDDGAFPADVMRAISEFGVAPMQGPSPKGFNTDVDPSNVASEPNLGALIAAAKSLVVGEYRIDEKAPDFIRQVCAALSSGGSAGRGVPVGIGVFVDQEFENWLPEDGPLSHVDLADPNGGGHWLVITSYRTDNVGRRVFRGPNSWTDGWGDKGHFEVTDGWLRAACSDCYPFTVRLA